MVLIPVRDGGQRGRLILPRLISHARRDSPALESGSRFHGLSGSPEKSFGTPALRVPITVEFTASSLLAEPSTHFLHPVGRPPPLEKEKASCIIYRCLPASYPLLKDAYALMQRLKLDRTDFGAPLFINPLSEGERVFPYRLYRSTLLSSAVERGAFKSPRCTSTSPLFLSFTVSTRNTLEFSTPSSRKLPFVFDSRYELERRRYLQWRIFLAITSTVRGDVRG